MQPFVPHITQLSLRSLRMRAGLTQAELAALVGLKHGTISRWETGRSEIPKLAKFALFSILGSFDPEDKREIFLEGVR